MDEPAAAPQETPDALPPEQAAAEILLRERVSRATRCYEELVALLDRENCTLQIVTQEAHVIDKAGGPTAPTHSVRVEVVALPFAAKLVTGKGTTELR